MGKGYKQACHRREIPNSQETCYYINVPILIFREVQIKTTIINFLSIKWGQIPLQDGRILPAPERLGGRQLSTDSKSFSRSERAVLPQIICLVHENGLQTITDDERYRSPTLPPGWVTLKGYSPGDPTHSIAHGSLWCHRESCSVNWCALLENSLT